MRVFLLEAGGDVRGERRARVCPMTTTCPAFHAFACENAGDELELPGAPLRRTKTQQARDPKYDAARSGVLYPRAAALGGCTAHNAMIFMPPHDQRLGTTSRS